MKRPGIPRRAWIRRSTKPLARSSPPSESPRPRTRTPRTASETTRAHGSPERRAWMKRQPCVICGRVPSDAAHLKSGGTGRKDDAERTVPLCADYPDQDCIALGHHSEYDAGKKSFVKRYAVDLPALAAETQAAWERYAA